MKSRRNEVAALAKVYVAEVAPATADQVRSAYADHAASDVLDVACSGQAKIGEPRYYWRVGSKYYLDDATFGPVVAIDDLRYDPQLGLRDVRWGK